MKNKVLALLLCAAAVLFSVSGCGMKLQKSGESSPGSSKSPDSAGGDASSVIGVVGIVDGESVTLDMVKPTDPPDEEDVTANIVAVGDKTYALTGGTLTIDITNGPVVLLEDDGYNPGTLDDIDVDDFIVVALRGETVIAFVHGGPAKAFGGAETGGIRPEQPDVSHHDDIDESPEPAGVPDSDEEATYAVTTDGLNVRSGPSTSNSILGRLSKGAKVKGTVKNGWLKFTFDGKTAYCKAEYLEFSDSDEAPPSPSPSLGVPDSDTQATYVVGADDVNIRSGPSTSDTVLGRLSKGTILTGTVKDGWLKFTYKDQTAYCKADYLTAE
jgi:uncharacterized protein YraI